MRNAKYDEKMEHFANQLINFIFITSEKIMEG